MMFSPMKCRVSATNTRPAIKDTTNRSKGKIMSQTSKSIPQLTKCTKSKASPSESGPHGASSISAKRMPRKLGDSASRHSNHGSKARATLPASIVKSLNALSRNWKPDPKRNRVGRSGSGNVLITIREWGTRVPLSEFNLPSDKFDNFVVLARALGMTWQRLIRALIKDEIKARLQKGARA